MDLNDDVAMIAAMQLVDVMDLDVAWCSRNIRYASQEVYQLVMRLVEWKDSRLNDFSKNTITCILFQMLERQKAEANFRDTDK